MTITYNKTLTPPEDLGYWESQNGLKFWFTPFEYSTARRPDYSYESYGFDTEDPEIYCRMYRDHTIRQNKEYESTHVLFFHGTTIAFRDWHPLEDFTGHGPYYEPTYKYERRGEKIVEFIGDLAMKFAPREIQGRPVGLNEKLNTSFPNKETQDQMIALYLEMESAVSYSIRVFRNFEPKRGPKTENIESFPKLPLSDKNFYELGSALKARVENGELIDGS